MKGKSGNKNKEGKIGLPSSLARRQRLTQSPFRDLVRKLNESLYSAGKRNPLDQLRNAIPLVVSDPLEQLRESMQTASVQKSLDDLRVPLQAIQFESPLAELQKTLNGIQFRTAFENLSDQIRSFQPTSSFEQFTDVMKDVGIRNSFAELLNSVRATHSFQEIYDNIFIDSTAVNSVEESYKQIFTRFIIAESETGVTDTAAQRTAAAVQSSVRSAPKTRLSFEFYLSLIISLALFVYSLRLNQESEARIISEINGTYQDTISRLEEIETNKTEIYCIVTHSVNLREKPTSKNSKVLSVLSPNLVTKLIDREGDWLEIEYFDHTIEANRSGWCYRRYLKRIKRESLP